MQLLKPRSRRTAEAIVLLPVDEIAPNPFQPRRTFDEEALGELADSIRRYGVLSPLSVRCRCGQYELIAGERRLRASQLAGLHEVPCILLDVDAAESGAIALVENLQRRDLDYVEQAQGIARLIELFGLSQEECARRLGKSQSAIANKLRLLHLPPDVLEALRNAGLSERHGRALLRLPDDGAKRQALCHIIEREMTVSAADAYIDNLLAADMGEAKTGKTLFVLKDVKVFLNTLLHSVELMRQGGVDVDIQRQETEEELVVIIRVRR